MIIKKNSFQKKLAAREAQQRAEEEAQKVAEAQAVQTPEEHSEEDIEQAVFDIDNIDFTQREERRT